jgi:hypothetical protein
VASSAPSVATWRVQGDAGSDGGAPDDAPSDDAPGEESAGGAVCDVQGEQATTPASTAAPVAASATATHLTRGNRTSSYVGSPGLDSVESPRDSAPTARVMSPRS